MIQSNIVRILPIILKYLHKNNTHITIDDIDVFGQLLGKILPKKSHNSLQSKM